MKDLIQNSDKRQERPIVFSGPMVRAIRDRRKTQTRRIVTPQPFQSEHHEYRWLRSVGRGTYDTNERLRQEFDKATGALIREEKYHLPLEEWLLPKCPFGRPGDRLWVREKWALRCGADQMLPVQVSPERMGYREPLWYAADESCTEPEYTNQPRGRWRPSIHMPRWASRITLEITNIRVERVQGISHADCCAEGWPGQNNPVHCCDGPACPYQGIAEGDMMRATGGGDDAAIEWYADVWDRVNGTGAWDRNDWVWVLGFRKVEGGAA